MSHFVDAQGLKTVHAGGGGGAKNVKNLSTQLLNAPLNSSAKNDHGEEIFSSKAHFLIDSTKV